MNAKAERFWRNNERRLAGRLTVPERVLSCALNGALDLADLLLALGGAPEPQELSREKA